MHVCNTHGKCSKCPCFGFFFSNTDVYILRDPPVCASLQCTLNSRFPIDHFLLQIYYTCIYFRHESRHFFLRVGVGEIIFSFSKGGGGPKHIFGHIVYHVKFPREGGPPLQIPDPHRTCIIGILVFHIYM